MKPPRHAHTAHTLMPHQPTEVSSMNPPPPEIESSPVDTDTYLYTEIPTDTLQEPSMITTIADQVSICMKSPLKIACIAPSLSNPCVSIFFCDSKKSFHFFERERAKFCFRMMMF